MKKEENNMRGKEAPTEVHNHFEQGANCQVFNGSISGAIFAMPGSNVTQQIPPQATTEANHEGLKAKNKSTRKRRKLDKDALFKERELMTFGRKSGLVDANLTLLYGELCKEGWIQGNEADFLCLFSGKRDNCEFVWQGKYGKGTLVYLFRELIRSRLITIADGFALPAILEGHFKDRNGSWLTGLDKGDKPNNSAKPFIEECKKWLSVDLRDMLRQSSAESSRYDDAYDSFDRQDMHMHSKHGRY